MLHEQTVLYYEILSGLIFLVLGIIWSKKDWLNTFVKIVFYLLVFADAWIFLKN